MSSEVIDLQARVDQLHALIHPPYDVAIMEAHSLLSKRLEKLRREETLARCGVKAEPPASPVPAPYAERTVTGDGYLTRHLETRKKTSLSKGDVDGLVGRMAPIIRSYVEKRLNVAVGIVGEEVAAVERRLTRTPEQLAKDVSKGGDAYLAEKLAPLEARLAQLESRHELRYLGVYKADTMYPENSAVTFDGSIWVARTETNARPGGSALWTLAVKRVGKR